MGVYLISLAFFVSSFLCIVHGMFVVLDVTCITTHLKFTFYPQLRHLALNIREDKCSGAIKPDLKLKQETRVLY